MGTRQWEESGKQLVGVRRDRRSMHGTEHGSLAISV